MDKKEIRKDINRLVLAMPLADRSEHAAKIHDRVLSLAEFKDAAVVASYVSMPFEVSTGKLMRDALSMGKTLVLPRADWRARCMEMIRVCDLDSELAEGPKGIMEPKGEGAVQPKDIDFVIVPGRAFDRSCNRMGQGGGFYDRFLTSLLPACVTCAIAYEVQILDSVPVGEHDVPVDMVVTEEATYRRG